jgi:phosphatidylserine/phosphatidylglycerophosphate/cardiolipin synthase-like enzyme
LPLSESAELVREAGRLFDCDTKRQPYKAKSDKFIVSPVNARRQLAAFIKGAKRELLIYDIKASDKEMLRLIEDRLKARVKVQIIGTVGKGSKLAGRQLRSLRLHTRTIIRDRQSAFLGSQSLRKLELDQRREIGIIASGGAVLKSLIDIFRKDWKASVHAKPKAAKKEDREEKPTAKKVVRAVNKRLPVAPVVQQVVRVMRKEVDLPVDHEKIKKAVETEVKSALKKALKKAATKVVEETTR